MKLLLIYPSDFFQDFTSAPVNQQLFYLYSYVRHRAPEVEIQILDLTAELGSPTTADGVAIFLKEARILLERTGFDIAGISCWSTYNYPSSVEVAKLCKEINPKGTVIVGGYHPTFAPQDFCFPGTPFDYVVQSEGEKALLEIVQGKIAKDSHPQLVAGTPLPMEEHFLYWGEDPYHRTFDKMPLWLSRGCPFACVFCADRLTNYRTLTPQAAVAEIKRIMEHFPDTKTIMFFDPLFGIQREWRREFLPLLRQADLPVSYWAETRVDLLAAEDIDLVADMSFRLDLGLESVVPEMLAIMKKTTDPKRYLERCWEMDDLLNRRKVPHMFNHIFNHPGETSAYLKQALSFWQQYYKYINGDCYTYVGVNRFRLNPGSEVYINWPEYVEKYGCQIIDKEWWKQTDYPLGKSSSDIIPSRELAEAKLLDLPSRVTVQLTNMAMARTNLPAFRTFLVEPPSDWSTAALNAYSKDEYIDDKPLALGPRARLQENINGTIAIHSYVTEQTSSLDALQTSRLRELLAGKTLADMDEHFANYPNPEQQRDRLRYLLISLMSLEMLQVQYPEPQPNGLAGQPRLTLRTSAGDLAIELYPEHAPAAAASVLALLRAGYYVNLNFTTHEPSQRIEFGSYTWNGAGPGYTLPLARNDLPVRRGSLSLVQMGNRLHGGIIRLHRTNQPDDHAVVFGQVVAGWDVLDQLLPRDYLLEAVLPPEAR